jgi:hypothetical protein
VFAVAHAVLLSVEAHILASLSVEAHILASPVALKMTVSALLLQAAGYWGESHQLPHDLTRLQACHR